MENIKRIMELFAVQKFNQGVLIEVLEGGGGGGGGGGDGGIGSSASRGGGGGGGGRRKKTTLRITSQAPANLWSLQSLLFRKEALLNDFEGTFLPPTYPPTHPPVSPYADPPTLLMHPCICPSIHPFIHPSTYLKQTQTAKAVRAYLRACGVNEGEIGERIEVKGNDVVYTLEF